MPLDLAQGLESLDLPRDPEPVERVLERLTAGSSSTERQEKDGSVEILLGAISSGLLLGMVIAWWPLG